MKILHFITITPATAPLLKELRATHVSDEQLEQVLMVYYRGVPVRRDADLIVLNPQTARIGMSFERRFVSVVYEEMPDFVHIHGAWSHFAYRIYLWSKNRGFRVVFSPHGMMDKKVLDDRFWQQRFPRILLYQRRMLHGMRGVEAKNESEYRQLSRLGWNKRLDIVMTGDVLSGEVSPSEAYLEWYRKIIHTDIYETFTQRDKANFCALLRTANTPIGSHKVLTPQAILNLRELTPPTWRKFFILGRDHHVESHLRKALERMQLPIPSTIEEDVARYAWKEPKNGDALSDVELLDHSKRLSAILDNKIKSSEQDMRRLCIMLLNLRHHIKESDLSMRHICDFYRMVRAADIDENRLSDFLEELSIHRFARRMMQILHEVLYLEEGYMVVEPLDDIGTETIRKALITQE